MLRRCEREADVALLSLQPSGRSFEEGSAFRLGHSYEAPDSVARAPGMTAQAGAIAVRLDGAEPLVLLVTARRNPEDWIFPKGHVEPGEELAATAIRELDEEAGVKGELLGRVGSSTFRSGGEDIDVTYFLVRAMNEGEVREGRRRLWLPPGVARERLSFPDARELLDKAMAQLTTR